MHNQDQIIDTPSIFHKLTTDSQRLVIRDSEYEWE